MQTLKEYYSDPETIKRLIHRFQNLTVGELKTAGRARSVSTKSFVELALDVIHFPEEKRDGLFLKALFKIYAESAGDYRFGSLPENEVQFTSKENLLYLMDMFARYLIGVYEESYPIKRFLLIPVRQYSLALWKRKKGHPENIVLSYYYEQEKGPRKPPDTVTLLDVLRCCYNALCKNWIPTCKTYEAFTEGINQACRILCLIFVDSLAEKPKPTPGPDKPYPLHERSKNYG